MSRIPIRARPFVFVCGVILFGLIAASAFNAAMSGAGGASVFFFVTSLIFAAVSGYVLIRDLVGERAIVLGPTHLEMPGTLLRRGVQRVDYADIRGIEIATIKLYRMLQVQTRTRRHSVMDFEMPPGLSLEELREAIGDAAEIATGRKLD